VRTIIQYIHFKIEYRVEGKNWYKRIYF